MFFVIYRACLSLAFEFAKILKLLEPLKSEGFKLNLIFIDNYIVICHVDN